MESSSTSNTQRQIYRDQLPEAITEYLWLLGDDWLYIGLQCHTTWDRHYGLHGLGPLLYAPKPGQACGLYWISNTLLRCARTPLLPLTSHCLSHCYELFVTLSHLSLSVSLLGIIRHTVSPLTVCFTAAWHYSSHCLTSHCLSHC